MMKSLLVFVLLFVIAPSWAEADVSKRPYDIYLTGDRICKKCTLETISPETVQLKNRKGETGIYPASEIIGFNTHPIARRYLLHMTHEIGFPARVIVPQAFEGERYLNY